MAVTDSRKLRVVKTIHTIIWALIAGAIIAIPLAARRESFTWAGVFIAVALAEVAVIAVNGMRCPLTDVAARFTDDRHANFDIYLPLAIARHNKQIFGTLLIAGLLYTFLLWTGRSE